MLRVVTWILAILPCCVLYVAAKLVALPVFLFRSLDPEHALYSTFYTPLFSFLHADEDTDLRLKTVNVFFAQAKREISFLQSALQGDRDGLQERLLSWANNVGSRLPAVTSPNSTPSVEPEPAKIYSSVLRLADDHFMHEADVRRKLRRHVMQKGVEGKIEDAKGDLSVKSAVVASLQKFVCFPAEEPRGDIRLRFLRVGAACCLSFVSIALVGWLPVTLSFVFYGFAFPIIHLVFSLLAMDSQPGYEFLLPHYLSFAYLGVITCLLCFMPSVAKFQLVRADIVGVKGFPPAFYTPALLPVLEKRYRRAMVKRKMTSYMQRLLSKDCARIVADYCGDDFISFGVPNSEVSDAVVDVSLFNGPSHAIQIDEKRSRSQRWRVIGRSLGR
eukprot:gb/GEZN01008037.1/.p1 GENE.gb/GEZN01008037.1/~~gb/GEZN01008037.1/.p1  ORF type:complete len:427 (-),score=39.35 gb/GEZN01008037.1/:194-1354(-)